MKQYEVRVRGCEPEMVEAVNPNRALLKARKNHRNILFGDFMKITKIKEVVAK